MDLIKYDMTDIWAVAGDVVAPDSAKIRAGWGVEVVPRQWWNWFENRQDNNIAYMLQKGFAEWDATTQYISNKSYVQRNGIVYKATATSTNSDPVALTSWVRAFADYSVSSNALGALTPAADQLPYFNGNSTATTTTLTPFARTILDDSDAGAVRTTISAQQSNVNLTSLSGVTAVANGLPYFTGTTSMGVATLTAFGRSLIDDVDAVAARVTLGVSSSADVAQALADGLATRQPLAANLTALAALAITTNTMPYYNGTSTLTLTPVTSYGRGFLNLADALGARTYIGADDASNLTTGTIPLARIPLNLTGVNAATATKLATARTIQGVPFDGSSDITLSVVDKDSAVGSAALPAGTSAQRTASPSNGMLRYNNETNEFEGFQNGAWAGIGGGTPLYTVLWWPNRASIPAGYIPADGQLLSRASYQAAFAGVNSGILPVVSDATWLANSINRGCYTPGNGTTTFRIPDLNGTQAGTVAAPFLRGDGTLSNGTAGTFQQDALQGHQHAINLKSGSGASSTYGYSPYGAGQTSQYGTEGALTAGRQATETRPTNVTGVFVIKLIGGASELSQDDASVAVAALENKVAYVSGRNRIINGSCIVVQRPASAFGTTTVGYAGPDRYRALNSASAGGSFTQAGFSTLTYEGVQKNTVRQTVTSPIASTGGTNYWQGINQLIEGYNCYDFVGKDIVVSFLFNTNVTGTYSVSLRDSSSIAFVTKFSATANTPIRVEFTTKVPLTAVIGKVSTAGFQIAIGALNQGTYQTSSLDGWQSGVYMSAAGFTNWGSTNGNYIEATDIQIELGTVATDFETRPFGVEYANCLRYYEEVDCILVGYGLAGTNFGGLFPFKATKRATPSLTLLQDGVRIINVNVGALTGQATTQDLLVYRQSVNTAGSQFHERYRADAEL